jgi:hypothetical protein
MTSGRTVEETVLLALVVYPSPGKRVPSGLGLARYQVTSTPWRARHNILSRFNGSDYRRGWIDNRNYWITNTARDYTYKSLLHSD